jgi:ubiquinone/menaquinone biosynthesis C-methylase UbiE
MISAKKIFTGIIPHGIVLWSRSLQRKKRLQNPERLKIVDYKDNLTQVIGDDWIADNYYIEAEQYLHLYWNPETIFYKRFQELDCTNIVELAVGHGRHVPEYLDKAKNITLVDINEKNINFCRKRFANEKKIKYVICSGRGFDGVDTASQTAVFTYDSMVHFEILDVAAYLKDANRILVKGGRILFHHSNAAFSPGAHYSEKPHWRNFMSAGVFAHLAMRMGFRVLSQDLISWGAGETHYKDLDCLSLCEKIQDV